MSWVESATELKDPPDPHATTLHLQRVIGT